MILKASINENNISLDSETANFKVEVKIEELKVADNSTNSTDNGNSTSTNETSATAADSGKNDTKNETKDETKTENAATTVSDYTVKIDTTKLSDKEL